MKRGISCFEFANKKYPPKSKHSQISIFIIIAIALVVAIFVFYLVKSDVINLGSEKIHPDVKPIHSYVVSCVESTGEEAIERIGLTGGYAGFADKTTDYGFALYFDKGDLLVPSKQTIEEQLSIYMNDNLWQCIDTFNNFPDFEITRSEVTTKTNILNTSVIFDVNYPLSINKGANTYELESFSATVPVRLGVIYNSIVEYYKEEDGESVCITCADRLGTENELYINTLDYDNETVLFVITDKKSKILDKDYEYAFASRYEWLDDNAGRGY